jgi:hypothetical protein
MFSSFSQRKIFLMKNECGLRSDQPSWIIRKTLFNRKDLPHVDVCGYWCDNAQWRYYYPYFLSRRDCQSSYKAKKSWKEEVRQRWCVVWLTHATICQTAALTMCWTEMTTSLTVAAYLDVLVKGLVLIAVRCRESCWFGQFCAAKCSSPMLEEVASRGWWAV